MNEDHLEAYARLLLESGLNLQPGMNLLISSEPVHWPFLNRVTEQAYRMGARYVEIDARHPRATKARVDHAPEEYLEYLPAYLPHKIEDYLQNDWARLALIGSEEPELMADLDQARNAIVQKAGRQVMKPLMAATGAGRVPWCVAAIPTPAWAAQVMECEASDAAVDAMWEVLVPILRLDHDDPVAAWADIARASDERGKKLTEHAFTSIRFEAPGTELKVRCNPNHVWEGGDLVSEAGHAFIPNLPTEEVFTTPDWRGTEGRARVTRPVEVMGANVHGAWFQFEAGRVTDFGADEGAERLQAFFEVDEQARYLGEVALVDGSSPIFKSGKTFHNILYDENAACHIALGSGYPTGVSDGVDMSAEEQSAAGINQCLLHTDFMIGCPEVRVTGIAEDGGETPVIVDGNFVAPFDE